MGAANVMLYDELHRLVVIVVLDEVLGGEATKKGVEVTLKTNLQP